MTLAKNMQRPVKTSVGEAKQNLAFRSSFLWHSVLAFRNETCKVTYPVSVSQCNKVALVLSSE